MFVFVCVMSQYRDRDDDDQLPYARIQVITLAQLLGSSLKLLQALGLRYVASV